MDFRPRGVASTHVAISRGWSYRGEETQCSSNEDARAVVCHGGGEDLSHTCPMTGQWRHRYAREFRRVTAEHPEEPLDRRFALTSAKLRDDKAEGLIEQAARLSRRSRQAVDLAVEDAVKRLSLEGTPQEVLDGVKGDLNFTLLSIAEESDRENLRTALELRTSSDLVRATKWLVVATSGLVLVTLILVIVTMFPL